MKKLLMTLAGYDSKVAALCPVAYQNKYAAMGGAILITVFMAIFGALHLAKDVTHNVISSLGFAAFWGAIVLGFEYMMVNLFGNNKGKWLLLTMRIVMSMALSTLLALPFILLLFKPSINQQLSAEKQAQISKVDSAYQTQVAALDTAIDQRIRHQQNLQNNALLEAEGKKGTMQKGTGEIYELKKAASDSAYTEFVRYKQDADKLKIQISNQRATEVRRIEEYYSNDMLAQLMALINLMKIKPIVIFQTLLIFFILLLLDLMPIILKTTSALKNDDDPYNQLTKQERVQRLNAAINSIRNDVKNQQFKYFEHDMPGRAGFDSYKAKASTVLKILAAQNEYLELAKETYMKNPTLATAATKHLKELSDKTIAEILQQELSSFTDISLSEEYQAYIANAETLKKHHPFAANQAIVSTVKQVSSDLTTEQRKFEALYEWVATNVSYDKDHEQTAYRTAIETFNAKRGICGEMAALLITMCRVAGIKADYVTVTKDVKGETVCHACAGVVADGVFILADPAYASKDILHQEYKVEADNDVLKKFESWNNTAL